MLAWLCIQHVIQSTLACYRPGTDAGSRELRRKKGQRCRLWADLYRIWLAWCLDMPTQQAWCDDEQMIVLEVLLHNMHGGDSSRGSVPVCQSVSDYSPQGMVSMLKVASCGCQ